MPEPAGLKDKQFATTLANGIALLGAFDPTGPVLANKDFVERTGLDPATVSRLTFTLVELGLLAREPKRRGYRLAPGVLRLGYPLLASLQVRQRARPFMLELASGVRGTVGIAVAHHTEMVYLDAVVHDDGPDPRIDRGMPIPVVTSAMGRAWLAAATPAERERALNLQRVRRPDLHRAHAQHVAAAVRAVRDQGYCWSAGARLPDRLSVAAPFGARIDGQIVVFNCTVIAADPATFEDKAAELGPRLLQMLRRVEGAAGLHRATGEDDWG